MKRFYRYATAACCLVLMLSTGLLAAPATAQSSWGPAPEAAPDERTWTDEPRTYDGTPRLDDPASTRTPDWADSGASEFESGIERYDFGAEMNNVPTQPPPNPDDPTQEIPIDGGLSLLALAGAGYAVNRLRKRGDDEDDEDTMP